MAPDPPHRGRSGRALWLEPAERQKRLRRVRVCQPDGSLAHRAHLRGAFTGDAVARLLEAQGWDVTREYYVNDAGRQVDTLARSTLIRYQQRLGVEVSLPEDHYPGDYVKVIAEKAYERFGDQYVDQDPHEAGEWLEQFRSLAVAENLAWIKADLAQMNVHFDVWQSERSLVAGGAVERALAALKAGGESLYEEEGKLWFRSTAFGDDKDRVVLRDTGEGTYFASDIAYHKQKMDRGFDRLIDIWGLTTAATSSVSRRRWKRSVYPVSGLRRCWCRWSTWSKTALLFASVSAPAT